MKARHVLRHAAVVVVVAAALAPARGPLSAHVRAPRAGASLRHVRPAAAPSAESAPDAAAAASEKPYTAVATAGATALGLVAFASAARFAAAGAARGGARGSGVPLALVGGLLSSSCCAIQLALNAVSLGCAGFAALDASRPLWLLLTAGSLCARAARGGARSAGFALTCALALALAAMPEMLRAAARRRGAPGAAAPSIAFAVAGIPCEACARKACSELTDATPAGGVVITRAQASSADGFVRVWPAGAADEDARRAARAAVAALCAERGWKMGGVLDSGVRA